MKFLELFARNLIKPTPVPSRGGELLEKLEVCFSKPWRSSENSYFSFLNESAIELYHKVTRRITKNRKEYLRVTSRLLRVPLCISRKQIMLLGLILSCLTLFYPSTTTAQNFTQTINKTAEFVNLSDAGNKFIIKNIHGSVTIEGYDGDTIELTVNEAISGSPSETKQARQELEYKMERRGNLIFAYLDAPFITVNFEDGKINYCINRQDDDYQFTHDVTVRVPRGILLEGSTINKGTLSITGNFREVDAGNVNGDVSLEHMTSKTKANTVNGDITITYDEVPGQDSEYHTVNGTIEVYMPDDLSADVYFKSLHGDLYTDFDNVTRLTPQVNRETDSHGSVITYRLDKFSPLRIGNGGTKLRFRVLNGDVYIRKQS